MAQHAKTAVTKREKERGFYIHLAVFVLVNAFLVGLNLATAPSRLWFQWVLMGWGIGILGHAAGAFDLAHSWPFKSSRSHHR